MMSCSEWGCRRRCCWLEGRVQHRSVEAVGPYCWTCSLRVSRSRIPKWRCHVQLSRWSHLILWAYRHRGRHWGYRVSLGLHLLWVSQGWSGHADNGGGLSSSEGGVSSTSSDHSLLWVRRLFSQRVPSSQQNIHQPLVSPRLLVHSKRRYSRRLFHTVRPLLRAWFYSEQRDRVISHQFISDQCCASMGSVRIVWLFSDPMWCLGSLQLFLLAYIVICKLLCLKILYIIFLSLLLARAFLCR